MFLIKIQNLLINLRETEFLKGTGSFLGLHSNSLTNKWQEYIKDTKYEI